MAEKKTKKNEETPVEETAAEATETEAAAPSVDEGEPMASTEAMDDVAEERGAERFEIGRGDVGHGNPPWSTLQP